VAQRRGAGRWETLEAPFVGRDEDLRLLKELLHTTGRDRRIRLASITGPAGIGKSRLVWELEKYMDGIRETIYWHRGRSPAYGEGITFWALGEMVRQRARLAETDDEPTTRARVAETVAEYVPDPEDRRWIEPALLALLGLEPSPPGGRDALFSAWRMFFERVAERGTTALVFEDLQWADTGQLDFIDHLLEWSKGVPLLLITLARPELFDRRRDWGAGKRNFSSIALEPLTEKEMRELLAGLVPGLPEPAVAAIVARADGVPLYAVETVRMLVTDGRVAQVDGVYRPVGDLGELAVPDSLRSLIASRLDSLDPAERSLIQDAAVLGQSFTPAGLAAVAGVSEEELGPRLASLVRRELFRSDVDPRSPERGQYLFVQALIREVAYGTLAKGERRRRHVAAAEFFESLGDDELAGAVARQYLDAYQASPAGPEADQLAERARQALTSAAERAAALGAHDQAVAFLELALSIAADPATQGDLLERAATSGNAAARYTDAEGFAKRAIEVLRPTGDDAAVARAMFQLGQSLINLGNSGAAVETYEAALAERPLGREDVDEAQARLLAGLAHAYQRHAEYDRAMQAADRAMVAAELLDLEPLVAQAMVTKGTSMVDLGRRRESVALLEGGIRLARQTRQIFLELRARNNLALAVVDDDPVLAAETLRDGLELAERAGDRQMSIWLAGTSAVSAWETGEGWDEILERIEGRLTWNLEAADRLGLTQVSLGFRAQRGEPVIEHLDALMNQLQADMTDMQMRGGNRLLRADAELVHGDFESAFRNAMEAMEIEPGLIRVGLFPAGMAALLGRDVDKVRLAAARYDAMPRSGRNARATRAFLHAALAALEGRRADAIAGFRDVVRGFRDVGARYNMAWAGLAFVLAVGPADPEARAAAEEAREVFVSAKATPWVERVDAVLSGKVPPILAPATAPQEAPIV
jgi:predicted ATPase